MIDSGCFEKAFRLARAAHAGQVDRSGLPVIYHATRVAAKFLAHADFFLASVAILHDVLEDTDVSEDDLREEFPAEVVDAVVAITRDEDETYKQYIKRCCENDRAREVKKADIHDNLSEIRLYTWPEAPIKRYYDGLCIIKDYEIRHGVL